MTGVHLYQDRLILRSNTGSLTTGNATALTNGKLAIADDSGDSDINAAYRIENGELRIENSKELFIWNGSAFTPGNRVKTHDLDVRGTMTMGTNGLTVSGSLVGTAGLTTTTGTLLTSTSGKETLSGAMALQNVTIDNGLLGYLKLDDGSGSAIAKDSSRNGNHGTLNGFTAAQAMESWKPNPTHTGSFFNPAALEFDGTDDYVDVGVNTYGMGIRRSATFSAWIKIRDVADVGGYNDIISDWNTTGMSLRAGQNGELVFYVYPNDHRITYSAGMQNDTWYHIVGVMDEATMYVYLNGAQKASAALGEDIGNSTSSLKIGQRGDLVSDTKTNGLIDDVRIYNRALAGNEIASLANGNPSTGSGVYSLGTALNLSGNLGIYAGGIRTGNAYGITLSGSWIKI